jgi:hypothetical protein
MVIRVSVGDATSAFQLMRRLGGIFDRSSVSLDRPKREVRVEAEWESRAVMGVVEAVESWLEESGADWATLSVGDRSHTMFTSTPGAVSQ